MRIALKVVTLTLTLMGLFWAGANSEVIYVPTNQPTIQAGINAAASGDTVVVEPGIYTGAGNRDLSTSGKTVLVMGQFRADSTIIDCDSTHNGFDAVSSGTEIRGLTIR